MAADAPPAAPGRGAALPLLALGVALVVAFLIDLAYGSVSIPLREVLRALSGGTPSDPAWRTIVLDLRLPKALCAALAGAALATSGLQLQTLFRNPLADPFILGINAGASLGVALVLLGAGPFGGAVAAGAGLLGHLGVVVAACLGAAAVLGLVLLVARRVPGVATLLILGLMVSYTAGSLVTLLVHFSRHEAVRSFVSWSAGSFGGVTWSRLAVLAPVVGVGLLLAGVLVKPLNALLLGEGYAASMGLRVSRARAGIIAASAMLAGAVTAFCGPIGFLGVAVPHFARGLFQTADHRVLLPACAMLGALLALGADLLAQAPGGGAVLPINTVTALLGAPVVAIVILRGQRGGGLES